MPQNEERADVEYIRILPEVKIIEFEEDKSVPDFMH